MTSSKPEPSSSPAAPPASAAPPRASSRATAAMSLCSPAARTASRRRGARSRSSASRALAIPTDVADWKAVEAAADQIERELGPIDIWVNNAFAGIFSPLHGRDAGGI